MAISFLGREQRRQRLTRDPYEISPELESEAYRLVNYLIQQVEAGALGESTTEEQLEKIRLSSNMRAFRRQRDMMLMIVVAEVAIVKQRVTSTESFEALSLLEKVLYDYLAVKLGHNYVLVVP